MMMERALFDKKKVVSRTNDRYSVGSEMDGHLKG